jgi:uncharacterized protein YjbI with pentapeptide repeats
MKQFPLNSLDLKGVVLKKSFLYKLPSLIFVLSLVIAANYLIGALSGFISKSLFYSPQLIQGFWLVFCIILAISAWGFKTRQLRFVHGIWSAGITVTLTSTIVWLASKKAPNIFEPDFIWVNALVTPVFLGGYILAFLMGSFCLLSLLNTTDSRDQRKIKFFFSILTIGLPGLVAYLIGGDPPISSGLTKDYFGPIKVATGLLSGLFILSLSLNFVESRNTKSDLDFLRLWSIIYSTLGSTSFHGLDLSRADLTGANISNTDFRAANFYRTCLKDVKGLDRARVDNHYFDLDQPKVQMLLTQGFCYTRDFVGMNLQGAYLRSASDMREFNLTDAKLDGADLQEADLRGSTLLRTQLPEANLQQADLRRANFTNANLTAASLRAADLRDCIFVWAQVARTDFTGADLTGACIEDWSISSKTTFTDVRCDYVFRQYENGQPSRRYPSDRNFEPGEFAALFQQPENELELIFKGDFSYNALSLAFYKLKTEKPELDLELKGIEQRGKLWVVRVTSSNPTVEARLEQEFSKVYQAATNSESLETTIKDSIYRDYEDIKQRLAESQQLLRQFAGISESQAEALKQLSKQALGTNFYIEGSNITNLTGQGQIEYTEAAGQIRSLVTQRGTEAQVSQGSQKVLAQLHDIATILLKEAENDPVFRQFLLQQQQQILTVLPPGAVASAIQNAISQLTTS